MSAPFGPLQPILSSSCPNPSLLDSRAAQALKIALEVFGILEIEKTFAGQRTREHHSRPVADSKLNGSKLTKYAGLAVCMHERDKRGGLIDRRLHVSAGNATGRINTKA